LSAIFYFFRHFVRNSQTFCRLRHSSTLPSHAAQIKNPHFSPPFDASFAHLSKPYIPTPPLPFRPLRTNTTLESMGIQVDISPHHGYFPAKKP